MECGAGRRPLFIMFNYDKCVNVVPQAVRVAWVNIRGVHRVRGAPNYVKICVCFSFFAPFLSRPGLFFSKIFCRLLCDLVSRVSVCCVVRRTDVCVLHDSSQ